MTALSLSLQAQRQDAEETLTLLAASNAIEEELNSKLADALIRLETAETALNDTETLQLQLAQAEAERDTLQAELTSLRTRLSQAEADLSQLGASASDRDEQFAALQVERDALAAELDVLKASATDSESLREQLAAALAARLAAEQQAEEQLTERERQDTLLATARRQLQEEEAVSTQAQRQIAALNQQIATLRAELDGLQGLLDAAADADEASQIRIDALGAQLNQALARAAATESANRFPSPVSAALVIASRADVTALCSRSPLNRDSFSNCWARTAALSTFRTGTLTI